MFREEKLVRRMGRNESPDSVIRLEMRRIWLEGRDVVLSGDVGTRYRYSPLRLERSTCSQKDWLLCCQVPKKLHHSVFRTVSSRAHSPNFMPFLFSFFFLLTALCPVTLLPVPVQSELIMIMLFKDKPSSTSVTSVDLTRKNPGEPFISRTETE